MNRKHKIAIAFFLTIFGNTAAFAADPFPNKPLRIVVTSAPGGLLDATARAVALKMGDKLGQQIVVENRVGAGGLVAIRYVKSQPADGYTILAVPNTIAIQQVISTNPGYDIEKDFAGIGPMTRAPHILVVSPEQSWRNLGDFMTRAKAMPGSVTYASAGVGTATHIGAARFSQRTGLNLTHVPYQGNPAAWPDVISKRVDMIFEPYGSGAAMITSGKLKPLGVASFKRLEALPNVPTFIEQGVPNFTSSSWFGLLASAQTPKPVVKQLSDALHAALISPDMKERFRLEGSEVMMMSPDEFNKFLKGEVTDLTRLVNDIGLPRQ